MKSRFTSKTEVLIREHFIDKFKNDGWTFGGNIRHKEEQLVRDLYSKKLKVCFEYDGIWHFKDIHGQLKKKQMKDKYLEEWCLLNGYRLIRYDENSFNKQTSLDEIEDLIYNRSDDIIKIGDRY